MVWVSPPSRSALEQRSINVSNVACLRLWEMFFACDALHHFCQLKAHGNGQTDRQSGRQTGRLGDRPRTDCQVHPTVCQLLASAASAHIYQHYLTNYKRNLIYPVIFYVRKHSRQPWKVVFDCSTHTSLHKYLHKYFVFHTFHMQTLASSPWQRMQL